MASKKKEVIALLSLYNDEGMDVDDDDEEEEDGNAGEARDDDAINSPGGDSELPLAREDYVSADLEPQISVPASEQMPFKSPDPPTPPSRRTPITATPPPWSDSSEAHRARSGSRGIVDYGHDESAMSPEAEDMEMEGTGRVMVGAELELGNLHDRTPQVQGGQAFTLGTQVTSPSTVDLPERPKDENHSPMDCSAEPEGGRSDKPIADSAESQREINYLEKFLPPPPEPMCSEELQEKINKFLAYKKAGKSFNADLRNRKDYRNPDFLLHAVTYQEIDQIGTCFSKDVFDPHGYDPSDYYDVIETDMKRQMDRKEQERKKNQKIDFVQGNVKTGAVIPPPRIGAQIPVPVASATGGLLPVPTVSDASSRDGRPNKRSKWDKVDGDPRNSLQPGGLDNFGTSGHAALLAAANAGGGYSAFVQQKRKEAEEKRSSERRSDKRS